MAMSGKKTSAMLPEPRPDLFEIRLWNIKLRKAGARKEFKPPFAMCRWQACQPRFHFKQEHQPMTLALVTIFTNQTGQVQIGRGQFQAQLFLSLTAGTGIG